MANAEESALDVGAALQELRGLVPDAVASGLRTVHPMPGGWEADLFRADGEGPQSVVVRRFSGAYAADKATAEAAVLRSLQGLYPVPQVYGTRLEDASAFGGPYIAMELIPGEPMMSADALPGPDAIETCAGLMVELHGIDQDEFAAGLARRGVAPDSRRVTSWIESWGQSEDAEIRDLSTWLLRSTVGGDQSVLHGDFHPGNVMWSHGRGAVVIDWTAASLGDHRFDLAWSILLAAAHAGETSGDAVRSSYEAAGGSTLGMEPFEVFACTRRLRDLAASMGRGAESAGMRPEALEAMRAAAPAYQWIAARLESLYGRPVSALFDAVDQISR